MQTQDRFMSPQWKARFKGYVQVTKPGIIFGNLISVAGGFISRQRRRKFGLDAGELSGIVLGCSLWLRCQ